MSEFHREILGNLIGLVSKDNLKPLMIGGLATAVAVVPEQDVEEFFLTTSRFDKWVGPGDYMGTGLVLGPLFGGLLLAGRQVEDDRFRSLTYSLAQGWLVNNIVLRSVKHLARRERPNMRNTLAFPSLHSANAFMWATVIQGHYKQAAIPAYIAATYVAASRLAENEHHLTDVVVGATIGYLVGRTVNRRMRRKQPSRVSWNVMPLPDGFVAEVNLLLP